jgi:hypothetical protein
LLNSLIRTRSSYNTPVAFYETNESKV